MDIKPIKLLRAIIIVSLLRLFAIASPSTGKKYKDMPFKIHLNGEFYFLFENYHKVYVD